MRILLASSKFMPEYSGSGYRAQKLYGRISRQNPEIKLDLICGSVTENSSAGYKIDDFEVHRIAGKFSTQSFSQASARILAPLNFIREYWDLASFWKALPEKPDILHIFGRNYVTASAMHLALADSVPVVIELCNEMEDPFQYVPFPASLLFRTPQIEKLFFICISEKLRKNCIRAGIRDEQIWCRPNPVDQARFHPCSREEKLELRKKLCPSFGRDRTLIVYVAKFRKSKNHCLLLDAIEKLPENFCLFMGGPLVDKGPNFEGDAAIYESLKKRIISSGLGDRVRLHAGFCEKIEEYYQMADLYAFPTLSEGLGTPMLESIACAVPVVANRLPDVSDVWIKDGQNGYLSSPDASDFAEKILLAAKIDRSILLKSSQEILEKSSDSLIDKEYLSLFKRLAKK